MGFNAGYCTRDNTVEKFEIEIEELWLYTILVIQ
jgi:hypothetical protein